MSVFGEFRPLGVFTIVPRPIDVPAFTTELVAASDVDNPLTGLFGAAKVFGPQKGIAEDRLKDMEKQIRAKVAASADFAENSPEPELAELFTDVLVESY